MQLTATFDGENISVSGSHGSSTSGNVRTHISAVSYELFSSIGAPLNVVKSGVERDDMYVTGRSGSVILVPPNASV